MEGLDRPVGSGGLMAPGIEVRPMRPREYGLLAPGMSEVELPRFRGRFIAWHSIGGLAAPLEVGGGSVAEAGVAPVGVIPPFDGLEDGPARFGLGREPVAVEEVAFETAKKLSAIALSWQSPTEPIEATTPRSRQRFANAYDVYWLPWSE